MSGGIGKDLFALRIVILLYVVMGKMSSALTGVTFSSAFTVLEKVCFIDIF
jgi:hypothetical protein